MRRWHTKRKPARSQRPDIGPLAGNGTSMSPWRACPIYLRIGCLPDSHFCRSARATCRSLRSRHRRCRSFEPVAAAAEEAAEEAAVAVEEAVEEAVAAVGR